MSIPVQLQIPERMKAKPAQQRPEKCERTNQERAMKKTLEIEFREEGREVPATPKKRRREQGASDYDREKVSEQFGGIFQGR
jgi:hypothetical protein